MWKHIGDIDDGEHKYGSTAVTAANRNTKHVVKFIKHVNRIINSISDISLQCAQNYKQVHEYDCDLFDVLFYFSCYDGNNSTSDSERTTINIC